MMRQQWAAGLAAAGLLSLAGAAQAVVIVNDTWKDDTRTDPASPVYSEKGVDADMDGDIESAWFRGGTGSTLDPVAGAPAGPLRGVVAASSASWTTYFAPESSPINLASAGDSLEVRWVFTPTGVANDVANDGQGFRVAVVDTPAANRLTTNTSPDAPMGGNYFGYAMFMNMDQTLRRSSPFELRERNAGVAAFLGTSSDWTTLIDNGATNDPGYMNGVSYAYTMTLTRNATSGLDIVSRMEGMGLGPMGQGFLEDVFSDPDPSSFTYDMFSIRPSAATQAAATFDTTLFRVQFTTTSNANFNGVGGVDGNDFLVWQRNVDKVGTGTAATGDANNDMNVDAADLAIWRGQYGTASMAAASAVPEPGALATASIAGLAGLLAARSRQVR